MADKPSVKMFTFEYAEKAAVTDEWSPLTCLFENLSPAPRNAEQVKRPKESAPESANHLSHGRSRTRTACEMRTIGLPTDIRSPSHSSSSCDQSPGKQQPQSSPDKHQALKIEPSKEPGQTPVKETNQQGRHTHNTSKPKGDDAVVPFPIKECRSEASDVERHSIPTPAFEGIHPQRDGCTLTAHPPSDHEPIQDQHDEQARQQRERRYGPGSRSADEPWIQQNPRSIDDCERDFPPHQPGNQEWEKERFQQVQMNPKCDQWRNHQYKGDERNRKSLVFQRPPRFFVIDRIDD